MASRQLRPGFLQTGVAAGLSLCLCATAGSVLAQQQLPGIVLSAPPTNPPAAPPGPPPAPPPSATEAPKAKPKPKAAAQPKKAPAGSATASADAEPTGPGSSGARAAVKVNGEPITMLEIEQRAKLLALQANVGERAQENLKRIVSSEAVNNRWKQIVEDTIKANPGKTREQIMAILETRRTELGANLQRQAVESAKASILPKLRGEARTELIEESLKMQEARRVGVKVEEAEVEGVVGNLAQQNKMTIAQFEKHFAGMGVDISTLRAKFRSNLAWGDVIRRKYSYLVNPNQREIDKLVANAQSGEDEVDLQLQRILISVPPKLDQRSMTQRFAEADQLRKGFSGCKGLGTLATKMQGARVDPLGARKPANFQEPTRTLLMSAQVGEMLPPNVIAQGIELIAVCERKVVKADEKLRQQAASDIRQREFEIQARRLIRDLQQDAIIENIGK